MLVLNLQYKLIWRDEWMVAVSSVHSDQISEKFNECLVRDRKRDREKKKKMSMWKQSQCRQLSTPQMVIKKNKLKCFQCEQEAHIKKYLMLNLTPCFYFCFVYFFSLPSLALDLPDYC